MSVHTKMPPIEDEIAELRFFGPRSQHAAAVELLTPLGLVPAAPTTVPWREAFADLPAATWPGHTLRGARGKAGLTQTQLAQMTGIPQRHLSEMEHSKRPIGLKTAKLLGKALHVHYTFFLEEGER
jgi:DNA-binding XRE family transcriptional regulator